MLQDTRDKVATEVLLSQLTAARLEIEALRQQLRDREKQVQELIGAVLEVGELEKERICFEIHDGVAQALASALRYLDTLKSAVVMDSPARELLLKARLQVKQAIQEAREVTNTLQPAILRDVGLVATLRQEMQQIAQETGWQIDFKADDLKLSQDVKVGLYRIIHEAITNARKHAHTKRVRLSIRAADNQVRVEVRDWGVGFNYSPGKESRRWGTGLLSIQRRAELLQGTCDIKSVPDQGTVVSVEIPFASRQEPHGQSNGSSGG